MEAISESWRLFTHFLRAQWLCCHTLLPAGFSSSPSTTPPLTGIPLPAMLGGLCWLCPPQNHCVATTMSPGEGHSVV